MPNPSEALASVLPPEKLKFALRRKLRKDAQEFTQRVEDSEEKCTLGPGLIDFTHPDIDDAWVRAYSLRVFEDYDMAPKTREEFAAYGLRLRGDWLRQAPGDSFYSRYEAAKPRMTLRKLQHDVWQKKRNVEAFVGVHLASRVPRDAWPKSKAETALFMLYVAEVVMVAEVYARVIPRMRLSCMEGSENGCTMEKVKNISMKLKEARSGMCNYFCAWLERVCLGWTL